ncbi:CHAD domain-containing protein [Burkholderia sp. 22PA0099]|uniref:CHAD domain-containing protein n=1 Tax=Burkholderia sp. 22PA0099 TaxID=3237372 RepID=UPI0039C0018C
MTRVLEIVLALPLPSGDATAPRRRGTARAVRDFGMELVRAWRICPPVRMKRGHERLAIRPLALAEAVPKAAGWCAWREAGPSGGRVAAARVQAFAPGVAIREWLDAPATVADAESAAADGDDALTAAVRRALDTDAVPLFEIEAGHAAATPVLEAALPEAGEPSVDATRAALPFGFDCERRRGRWQRDDGVPVDLTLDDLSWTTSTGTGRTCELRLAVADPGDAEGRALALRALFDAARELSGAWPAFLKPASLVDQACAGLLPDAATGPARAELSELHGIRSQREALFVLGANVAAQWLGNDAGVRDSNDPEFVHQMRVALRRLRTLMRLFHDFADDAYRDAFAADLSWFGAQLGVVRDWDVCVSETLPGLRDADPDPAGEPGWAATLDAAAGQRDIARGDLRQAVASARYARLVLGWIEWLCLLSLRGGEGESRRQRRSLKRHVVKRVDKLFARLYTVPKLTTLDPDRRHRVRIDAKRLRYALEFFTSIAARSTRGKLVKTLSRVQGTLGDANDAEVGLRHLERLSAPPEQLGFARGYGAAAQRYAAVAAEAELRKLRRPRIRG